MNETVNSLNARGSQTSQDKLQVAIEEIVKHLPKATTPTDTAPARGLVRTIPAHTYVQQCA